MSDEKPLVEADSWAEVRRVVDAANAALLAEFGTLLDRITFCRCCKANGRWWQRIPLIRCRRCKGYGVIVNPPTEEPPA